MQTRKLGNSDLHITPVGYGAWAIAGSGLRQAQGDLARISRVTTMGKLTASLAHEVNQPIAAAVTTPTPACDGSRVINLICEKPARLHQEWSGTQLEPLRSSAESVPFSKREFRKESCLM